MPVPIHVVRTHTEMARRTPIKTIAQWKRYYRSYCAAAGALHNTGQLSTAEYLCYFWEGIWRPLQEELKGWLQAMRPDHDPAQPWEMEVVCEVARRYLTRNRTYFNLPQGHQFGLDCTGAEIDSEDGSESEVSESEDSES